MSGKSTKIISIILWVLLGVSVVLVVLFYFGKIVPGTKDTNMEEPVITETFLRWTYLMAIVSTLLTLGFSLYNAIMNPKALKQTLFVALGAAILIIVAYFLSSDQILSMPGYEGTENVPGTLKWAGTGLHVTYLLAGLAVLSILYSEISKYFK